MRVVPVKAASGCYEVLIGRGLVKDAGVRLADLLSQRRSVVVTDETVSRLHAETLRRGLGASPDDFIVLPPGEATKSFAGLERVIDALLDRRLERGDLLVAFGGGVVGDLAGFAAAVFKRGMDFVQIPTTLLAQVDSSVGGKTAIDVGAGKNLVGAFHQPRRVLADLELLETLPPREVRCGFAEILKIALIGDRAFFEALERDRAAVLAMEPEPLERALARAVEMKAEIVEEDERESGRRALLNLGHTFGHALEAETGFGAKLLHGEAVAAGLALAFGFAANLGLCPQSAADRVLEQLRLAGLPTGLRAVWPDDPPRADRLVSHMAQDKKASGGRIVLVLPEDLGRCFLARGVEADRLTAYLRAEGAL